MKITFIRNTDAFFLKKTRKIHNSILTRFCAIFGSFIVTLLIIIGIFLLPDTETKITAITCLSAVIIDTIVVFIIKYSVRRTRIVKPSGLKYKYDPYSFPSGHISRLAAVLCCCCFQPILLIIILILTVCCFISRLIAGYHYFSDCIVGFFIGILSGIIAIICVKMSVIPAHYILYILNII